MWITALIGGCAGSPPAFPPGAGDTSGPPHDAMMSSSSGGDGSTTGAAESSTGCGSCGADGGTTLEVAETWGASSTGPMTTSGGSEDTGPPEDPYSSCPGGTNDECPEGEHCVPMADTTQMILATSCGAPRCADIECPAPSSGSAVPMCAAVGSTETCLLDCEAGRCPAGMECMATNLGHLCLWPV